jgi:hypothetical protein
MKKKLENQQSTRPLGPNGQNKSGVPRRLGLGSRHEKTKGGQNVEQANMSKIR